MPTVLVGQVARLFCPVADTITVTPGAGGRCSINGRGRDGGQTIEAREIYVPTAISVVAGDTLLIEAIGADATYNSPAGANSPVSVDGAPLLRRESVIMGGRRVVTLGASITNGSSATNAGSTSYSVVAGRALDARRFDSVVPFFGYPGQNPAFIFSQLQNALDAKPDILVLGPDFATNGASNLTPSTVHDLYGQYVIAAAKACAAVGVRLIVCMTLPQGSAAATANHDGIGVANAWLLLVGRKLGLEIVDTYTALLDHQTGFMAAAFFTSPDNVHPIDTGHAALAAALAAYINTEPSPAVPPWPVCNSAAAGGLANPLMLGSGTTIVGWNNVVSPSTFAGTATYSTAARNDATDLPVGQWRTVRCDAASAGGTLRSGSPTIPVVAGEILLCVGYTKATGTGSGSVRLWNGSASNDVSNITGTIVNDAASIPFARRLTVPAGCSLVRLNANLITTVGQDLTVYLGAANVFRVGQYGALAA